VVSFYCFLLVFSPTPAVIATVPAEKVLKN
jgi:hypothetical protein